MNELPVWENDETMGQLRCTCGEWLWFDDDAACFDCRSCGKQWRIAITITEVTR